MLKIKKMGFFCLLNNYLQFLEKSYLKHEGKSDEYFVNHPASLNQFADI